MSPSGKGGVPVNTPSDGVVLGPTVPPPPLAERPIGGTAPLRLWLLLLGFFLLMSSLTFLITPVEQVDALVAHARPIRRRGLGCGAAAQLLPWCSKQPPRNVDAEFAAHLVRSLGTTYGALGALSLTLTIASSAQQVLAALVLALWSFASISAQPDFLSSDDAGRRTTFHITVLTVDLLCVAWAVWQQQPPALPYPD